MASGESGRKSSPLHSLLAIRYSLFREGSFGAARIHGMIGFIKDGDGLAYVV